MFQYDELFYEDIKTEPDAKIIVPFIMQWLQPASVVDFGCGEGVWLREILVHNDKTDILGLDGSYVNRDRLMIPKEKFLAADLRKPIELGKEFDLAITTEVAEHVEKEFADIFIGNITEASGQILFSAAVPGQGGTNHINEQWQSYWVEKFEARGYYCDFSVRDFFWDEVKINSWRRQNLLFFSKRRMKVAPERRLVDVIHPEERWRVQADWRKAEDRRLDYYMRHPEIYNRLNKIIGELVRKDKKIVIYPYGLNGEMCEMILRIKYEVQDYIIADNQKTVVGKRIYTAYELQGLADGILVIDTCSNPIYHKEVLHIIEEYVDPENIYSAFANEE